MPLLHPFTPMDYTSTGIESPRVPTFSSAKGPYLTDADGTRYWNAMSGAFNLGAREIEDLWDDLESPWKQQTVPLMGAGHKWADALADRLAELYPTCPFTLLGTSGSEVVDAALQLSFLFQRLRGREARGLLTLEGSYHGTSLFPKIVSDALAQSIPDCGFDVCQIPWNQRKIVDSLLECIADKGPDYFVAMIVEPVQGVGGARTLGHDTLRAISQILHQHGILLICDEITCGLGQCGEWFLSSAWEAEPDFVVCGKGLTGGYAPLSALLTRSHIMSGLQDMQGIPLMGSTLGGNALSCAVALNTLETISQNNLLENARAVYASVDAHVRPCLTDGLHLQGMGCMFSITADSGEGFQRVMRAIRAQGILTFSFQGAVTFYPPLNTSHTDLDDLISRMTRALTSL